MDIDHAKWLVWHGKNSKSVARIKALDDSLMTRKDYQFSTLSWHLRRLYFYIDNNAGTRHSTTTPRNEGFKNYGKQGQSHRR